MKYYNLLKAWHAHDDVDFYFINSHEKDSAVRDSSQAATLRASLRLRLRLSKNMVLIVGDTTRNDTDWVPEEICYAVDTCGIPIIAAYTMTNIVFAPRLLEAYWPDALYNRITDGSARVIHVPFNQTLLNDAIHQFNLSNPPVDGLMHYTVQAHQKAGIRW
jgi:hypothetical protein